MKTSSGFRTVLVIIVMLFFIGAFPVLGMGGVPTNAVSLGVTPMGNGYWILDNVGQIQSFGDAQHYGNGPSGINAVSLGVTPVGLKDPSAGKSHGGYWILDSTGHIYSFNAESHGGTPSPVAAVSLGVTPTGNGYWILDSAGQIYSFGDAPYYGNGPSSVNAVSLGVTPVGLKDPPADQSKGGYWILDSLGQIYSFNAEYHGGTSSPVAAVSLGVTPTGNGYWILDSLGQIYSFGDAPYYGNGPSSVNAVSLGVTPVGLKDPPADQSKGGYWILDSLGQIYSFNAEYHGGMYLSIASTHILFEPPQRGDTGITPSIAMNNNNYVVSVHQGHTSADMYYQCGYVHPNNTVTWWSSGIYYDTGVTPSVAMNDAGYVVEVHQSPNVLNRRLFYHVGKFDFSKGTINWGPSHHYDTGMTPSVAMTNDGYVVAVHKGLTGSDLYCHVGACDFANMTINWGTGYGYDIGITPSVAMTDAGYVVEFHKGHTSSDLYYHVGACDFANMTINWGPSYGCDIGITPSVALAEDGLVVEVHQGHTSGNLYYQAGACDFANATIEWGPGRNFDTGTTPSVALNQSNSVQIHKSQDNPILWYSSALLIDHHRWMEDLRGVIGDKPLSEITLPGTHDAGMYFAKTNLYIEPFSVFEKYAKSWVAALWVTTQGESIFDQLMGGVRYFDLRPAWYEGELYIIHSFGGPEVANVFSDIRGFMDISNASGAGELVILVLSHLYYGKGEDHDFDQEAYQALGNLITQYLEPYLYTVADPQNVNLLKTTFNQYTRNNGNSFPRILLLVKCGEYNDWVDSGATVPKGVWPYQEMDYDDQPETVTGSMRIINDYANSPDPSTMKDDQLKKLEYSRGGDADRSFLLSWTLTAPISKNWWFERALNKPPKSLHEMSQYVKDDLPPFLRTYGDTYKINFLFTDYYEESATPNLAYLMNKGVLTDPPGPPVLDIKANGQDGPLLIKPGTPLSLTLSLNPGYRANLDADWWIAANTPKGWYSYVNTLGWQPGLTPYDQTALTDLSPPLELPGVSKGEGLYVYYFAIDDNVDGLPDTPWVDRVDVDVTFWR